MMKEGKNKLNEELLAKFLMGECSEEELREVNTWLNESDDNARELFRIEEIYHLGKSGDSTDEKKIEKAEKRSQADRTEQQQPKRKVMSNAAGNLPDRRESPRAAGGAPSPAEPR